MVLIGYSLGSAVTNIDRHIHLIIVIVVVLSFLPAVYEVLRHRSRKRKIVAELPGQSPN
jgi:hypothetical protein